jgi:hypothetical protein
MPLDGVANEVEIRPKIVSGPSKRAVRGAGPALSMQPADGEEQKGRARQG